MIDNASDLAFSVAVAFGITGLAIDAVNKIAPDPTTETAFEIHSLEVERMGNTGVIHFERKINYPIVMTFSVRVQEQTPQGYVQTCKTHSIPPFEYQPDAALPDTVTLYWWTDGACSELPDGAGRISTTWTPADDTYDPVTKNVYFPARDTKASLVTGAR